MADPWAEFQPITTRQATPLAPGYSIRADPTPTIYDSNGRMVAERDALPNAMALAERWARDRQRGPAVRAQNLDSLNRYRAATGLPPLAMSDLDQPEPTVLGPPPAAETVPGQPSQTQQRPGPIGQRGGPAAPTAQPPAAGAKADPWAEFQPAPAMAWVDVPGQALKNAPASAANFVSSLAHAVVHPIDTASSVADVAGGALRAGARKVLPSRVFNAIDSLDTPETRQRMDATAANTGQFIADRYGSVAALKKTLATDPVGAAADASMILTGGGSMAARAPGVVGQVGRTASAVGGMVDPLTAPGRVLAATGRSLAESAGVATGAGARPFREAFRAGEEANPAFTENMRGQVPVGNVVDMAENAVGQMGRDRSAQYTANMAGVKSGQGAVDFTPIYGAIRQAHADAHFHGVPIDAAAAKVVDQITDITNQFAAIPTPATPARFDALKRAVGEVMLRTQQGTLENRLAKQVFNAVKVEIVKQVPEYAKAMKDYSGASDLITEMRRTMSINDKAMTDTTLRKLQSTMRNNVNTNYGAREKLLDELARKQPDLPAALAGQSLNTLAPRGLARISPMTIVAGGGAAMNPLALAALPFTSPRLMGEAAYGAGRVSGAAQRAMQAAHLPPDVIRNALLAGYVADTPNRANRNALYGGGR